MLGIERARQTAVEPIEFLFLETMTEEEIIKASGPLLYQARYALMRRFLELISGAMPNEGE